MGGGKGLEEAPGLLEAARLEELDARGQLGRRGGLEEQQGESECRSVHASMVLKDCKDTKDCRDPRFMSLRSLQSFKSFLPPPDSGRSASLRPPPCGSSRGISPGAGRRGGAPRRGGRCPPPRLRSA